MTNPLVSIVIITRQRPHLIGNCVQHVLAQDYAPFEIIVVDASEDDATARALPNDARVRYVHLENAAHQIPRSRNEGIRHSHGDIIAFIDDDSMVQPGWLRHLVANYTSPHVGGVGGLVLAPGEAARTSGTLPHITPTGSVLGDFNIQTTKPVPVGHLRGCNMSFTRQALEAVGGFDVRLDQSNFRDETDVCVSVRRLGFQLLYDSKVAVIHLYSTKDGFQRDEWQDPSHYFSITKNITYFRLKHFFSLQTLLAVFIGAPILTAITNVRRYGARGGLLIWNDWRGRLAGWQTFLEYRRSKHNA